MRLLFVDKKGNVYSFFKNGYKKLKLTNTGGYLYYRPYIGKNTASISIHRLVAEKYIPNPNNYPEVNHINGIKHDNRVENLEWCTRADNMKHAYKTGLKKTPNHKGEKNPMAKLSNLDFAEIRSNKNKLTVKQMTEKYNVSIHCIYDALSGKTFKSIAQ